jgi:hypothetical protein
MTSRKPGGNREDSHPAVAVTGCPDHSLKYPRDCEEQYAGPVPPLLVVLTLRGGGACWGEGGDLEGQYRLQAVRNSQKHHHRPVVVLAF